MIQVTTKHGTQVVTSWHVEKPAQVRPKVSPARMIDGVMMYVGMGNDNMGKQYIQELFDKRFAVVKGKVKSRYMKADKIEAILGF